MALKVSTTGLDVRWTTPLKNDYRNDDVIQLGPLRSQSIFQFVHISDAFFANFRLQYFLYAAIN